MLTVDATTLELTSGDAIELRDRLVAALTRQHTFVETSGTHREDGSYVVSRRGANSSGHRKVFDSFQECVRLYERLPTRVRAAAFDEHGLTGSRRHMLLWHFTEHPSFPCALVSRQPLTARKEPADATTSATESNAR